MTIKILDQHLANQIAAGEVIERPASVLKELLENSIDAGSTEIEIEIENGGIDLIRIRDNGDGIPKEELMLALQRHATSKISKLEDLEKIISLGFRGEALSSIGSVARLTLASKPKDQVAGWQVHLEGQGSEPTLTPTAQPQGTTVTVRDLFFNTPARRKFLRTAATELRQIEEVINRVALSNFNIAITLKNNGKITMQFAQAISEKEKNMRIAEIMGKDFLSASLPVNQEKMGIKINGWISLPTFSRSQSDLQYFYVNGRIIRDKTINHAIRLAYEDVLFQNRQPAFVLYLELNPELVDVNVHPTKHEVRFRESRIVHDFCWHSLKQILANTKPGVTKEVPRDTQTTVEATQKIPEPIINNHAVPKMQMPLFLAEAPVTEQPLPASVFTKKLKPQATSNFSLTTKSNPLGQALAQLHGTYILAQNEHGLIIVDMHAAHERITYERLKKAHAENGIKSQMLLSPLTISVNKKEMRLAEEFQEQLKEIGLELESIGPEAIAIRKVPMLLSDADSTLLIRDLLADLSEHEDLNRLQNYTDTLLSKIACHYSVRSNRKLTLPEMDALLHELENTDRANQCSHGRPTWRQITREELSKMFLRTGN
jgi:DNA mismatch repair protein MutL